MCCVLIYCPLIWFWFVNTRCVYLFLRFDHSVCHYVLICRFMSSAFTKVSSRRGVSLFYDLLLCSQLMWTTVVVIIYIYHFYSFGSLDVCCAGKAAICNVIMKSSRRHPLNLYPATVATTLNPASSYARAFWPAMPSHSPYLVPGNYDQRHLFFPMFHHSLSFRPFFYFSCPAFSEQKSLSPHIWPMHFVLRVFCVSLSNCCFSMFFREQIARIYEIFLSLYPIEPRAAISSICICR